MRVGQEEYAILTLVWINWGYQEIGFADRGWRGGQSGGGKEWRSMDKWLVLGGSNVRSWAPKVLMCPTIGKTRELLDY